jgi:two-component system, NarL family, nitrate/nitrite response regulator NarL
MIRALLVVPIRPYREALARVLQGLEGVVVAATAAGVEDALTSLSEVSADVALVDVALGAAVIARLCRAAPQLRTIALAISEAPGELVSFAEAGASGFVSAQSSLSDIEAVLDSVVRGDMTISPAMTGALQRRLAELSSDASDDVVAHLTPREAEILRLVGEGLADKEIASKLSIEPKTVKNHVHNILTKLGARGRAEAAAWLRRARQRHGQGEPRNG